MTSAEAIAFGSWAQRLGRTPTPDEIRARFPNLSKSCAYRWRQYLLDAWGLPQNGRGPLKTHPAPWTRSWTANQLGESQQ